MHFQLYLYSILAFIIFILVQILTKKYSVQVNSVSFAYRRTAVTLLFSISWFFATGSPSNAFNFAAIYQVLICAFLIGLGLISFVESNKHLPLTNILSIQMLGILLKLLFDINFNFHSAGIIAYLFLSLALLGLFLLLSLPENRIGVFWSLLSSLSWFLGYELIFEPMNKLGAPLTLLLIESVILMLTILILWYRKKGTELLNIASNLNAPIVMIALLNTLAILVLAYGSKLLDIDMFSILTICLYPIAIVLIRYLFNEMIVVKEWIGILCIFLSVILFYLF
jgi:drug/metabolite transporter (DMT)-like permease